MDGIGLIIFLILLIGMGIGGYFGYKKWWIPRQCNNKTDSNLYIQSFMWDGSNCVANTCTTGYGTDAKGKPANKTPNGDKNTCPVFTASRTYCAGITGKCTNAGTAAVTTASSPSDCQAACDKAGTGCNGYDWTTGTTTTCDLYPTKTTTADGVAGSTCYSLQ